MKKKSEIDKVALEIKKKLIKSYLPNTTLLFELKQAEWSKEVLGYYKQRVIKTDNEEEEKS